jgi:hypothetical protein
MMKDDIWDDNVYIHEFDKRSISCHNRGRFSVQEEKIKERTQADVWVKTKNMKWIYISKWTIM